MISLQIFRLLDIAMMTKVNVITTSFIEIIPSHLSSRFLFQVQRASKIWKTTLAYNNLQLSLTEWLNRPVLLFGQTLGLNWLLEVGGGEGGGGIFGDEFTNSGDVLGHNEFQILIRIFMTLIQLNSNCLMPVIACIVHWLQRSLIFPLCMNKW